MPDLSVGLQIGVELTKLFGTAVAKTAANNVYESILTLARNLRLSGSDLLVEVDLADVFGRGKITQNIEQQFRTEVLRATELKAIQRDGVLALSIGPGPSLVEATPRSKEHLMASVIQLSFLGWVHNRPSLASALDDCLNKRFEMQIPGSKPSPGYEGISGVLEACSSQTSNFDWSRYLYQVKSRLVSASIIGNRVDESAMSLAPSLLRACMDCLYIIQRAPEERFMLVGEGGVGLVTLIVWAHHLLGLSVLILDRRTSQKVGYPSDDCPKPSIIISFNGLTGREPSVSILDRNDDEIIRIAPEQNGALPMETRERLKLRGYGTIRLCRILEESLDLFLRDPENSALVAGAEMTIALAQLVSQRLFRTADERYKRFAKCNIDRRAICDAARVFFAHPFSLDQTERLLYDEASAEEYSKSLAPVKRWQEMQVPPALQQPRYQHEKRSYPITAISLLDLSISLLCFSAVAGIDDCAEMKLVLEDNIDTKSDFVHRIRKLNDGIVFESHDLFGEICRLLVGQELSLRYSPEDSAGDGNSFMISDFGWTISLPTYGDIDPFTVVPERIFIREGVPTNTKTMERKNRVRDAISSAIEILGNIPPNVDWIRDRNTGMYSLRCVSPVHERIEYYGARENGFHLAIKFKGKHIEHLNAKGEPYWFEINQSCRNFHNALWNTFTAPQCQHTRDQDIRDMADEAHLGLGVATAAGQWSWSSQEIGRKGVQFSEKVIVVLVKDDKRARWLAVGDAQKQTYVRKVMLRGKQSCEDCAIKAAAALPGKWFVII